jgi:Ca2+-transporting ATPase
VHVVFLEFVIDPACTLVFEAEASDEGAMQRPPRPPAQRLFDLRMLGFSLLLGATMLAGVLAVYGWALASGRSAETTRAAAFAAIVFANLALILVTRSRSRTALALLRRPNPAFWWICGGALAALGATLYAPPLAALFGFAPLAPAELGIALAGGLGGVLWYDLRKLARSA